MKCANCGHEIKIGSVYCEKCGREVQIVPDYNLFEDDVIPHILEEKEAKKEQADREKTKDRFGGEKKQEHSGGEKVPEKTGGEKTSGKKQNVLKKIWRNKKTRWACIAGIVLVILIVIGAIVGLQHSYAYQYQAGVRQEKKEAYDEALSHYLRAAELDDESAEAKVGVGRSYYQLERYEDAKTVLLEAVSLDAASQDAYRWLIMTYQALEDYEGLNELRDSAKDEEILALFDEYLIEAPAFSQEEGEYDDDVILELSAPSSYEIYYTVDGSDPIRKGKRYREAITLTDGETTVRAVSKDRQGAFSQIEEKTYTVTYQRPDHPTVTPMQGDFSEPAFITIQAPEGSSVYYTWDGSTPTASSARYTDPIPVPEGNNVLSVIVIDEHGLCSDVLRCNYRYVP